MLIPDLMTALWIVGLLIVVFAISLGAERRFERQIDDQLTALHSAEAALSALQQTHPNRALPANVHVTSLSPEWSQVTVEINDASVTLTGPTGGTP
ncbi:MAG TPA: hypothetical protein VG722_04585 [Tepidisphaeraceae bacterium]|nr:hypothetical protein [Tepidisphaeraceae bacterium]